MMRSLNTQNWPELLKDAVDQLNSRALKKLNGLRPKDFNSPFDDVKLQQSQPNSSQQLPSASSSNPRTKPDVSEQIANQKAYESDKKELQVQDYVYVNNKTKSSFAKSYEVKVNLI